LLILEPFGANGRAPLASNTTGSGNTAIGGSDGINPAALGSNTTGNNNTAVGAARFSNGALGFNTAGNNNTAIGANALGLNTTGGNNIAVGKDAGQMLTTGSNNIDIGNDGASDEANTIRIGTTQTATFIAGIATAAVSGNPVVVDVNGQLGVAPAGSPLSKNELLKQQHLVQELKAMTERQTATIALQERQIEALTAGLQKVNARLDLNRTAPQTVANNP
jgi:hypothetical protein